MNIAYHSSDSYSMVLATSIASLLENNKATEIINIYVIEDQISDYNKQRLQKMVNDYNRNIYFIQMPDMNITQNLGLKAVRSDWIFNSYCRLYLDQILPVEVDRVLYLDSDVLILGDLTELWNTDLKGKCVAGVTDCLSDKYYELLDMSPTSHYCNSGVQLQDLKAWRERKVGDAVREYVHQSGGYIFFMEQTVFNVVLQDEILILPPIYNSNTLIQCLTYSEIIKLRKPRGFYLEEEIVKAKEQPIIAHLTSVFFITNRAWFEKTNHPLKFEFEKYKQLTPWKDEAGFSDNRTLSRKFVQLIINCIPRGFMLSCVGIIYNTVRVFNIKRCMNKAKREL